MPTNSFLQILKQGSAGEVQESLAEHNPNNVSFDGRRVVPLEVALGRSDAERGSVVAALLAAGAEPSVFSSRLDWVPVGVLPLVEGAVPGSESERVALFRACWQHCPELGYPVRLRNERKGHHPWWLASQMGDPALMSDLFAAATEKRLTPSELFALLQSGARFWPPSWLSRLKKCATDPRECARLVGVAALSDPISDPERTHLSRLRRHRSMKWVVRELENAEALSASMLESWLDYSLMRGETAVCKTLWDCRQKKNHRDGVHIPSLHSAIAGVFYHPFADAESMPDWAIARGSDVNALDDLRRCVGSHLLSAAAQAQKSSVVSEETVRARLLKTSEKLLAAGWKPRDTIQQQAQKEQPWLAEQWSALRLQSALAGAAVSSRVRARL